MGGVAYRTVDLALDRAEEECGRIVREPFAFSSVVTRRCPKGPERIVGVMNGVLLLPWFARRLLGSSTPYFHNHVRDAAVNPFPSAVEVGRANAGEGLDLFVAHYAIDPALDQEEADRVRGMFTFHFVEGFSGNRVRSLMVETVGRENTVMAESGGWEVVNRFEAWGRAHGVLPRDGPHLLQITHERAMEVQNLHMARLLQYRPPVFRFPAGARELLRFAMQGLTDKEIEATHGLGAKAISSGWTRILKTVGDVMPDLAASYPPALKSRERLALLAYLRNHPEELWPYGGA